MPDPTQPLVIPFAFSMRLSERSRPIICRTSKIPGLAVSPVSATRTHLVLGLLQVLRQLILSYP